MCTPRVCTLLSRSLSLPLSELISITILCNSTKPNNFNDAQYFGELMKKKPLEREIKKIHINSFSLYLTSRFSITKFFQAKIMSFNKCLIIAMEILCMAPFTIKKCRAHRSLCNLVSFSQRLNSLKWHGYGRFTIDSPQHAILLKFSMYT